MKFNIVVIDPPNYPYTHFLFDTCKYLCYGLESLGHSCCISRNQFDPARMTILVGGHLLDSLEAVDKVDRTGPYIVYQSEILPADGQKFLATQRNFKSLYVPLLQRAASVWETISHQLVPLAKLGVRAQFLRGGYHPAMREVIPKGDKDIDFLFYGSLTSHRQAMFEQLRQRGHSVVTMFDDPAIFRNDLIARTKVHVAPRQSDQMNHLPYSRLCYLLNNGGLIVVERCVDQQWLEDCFLWADTEHWVDVCEQTLLRPDREELANELHTRFQCLPITAQLEKVLAQL